MRTAEQIADAVLGLLDYAAREGVDVISLQGLQHLVGTREEVAEALARRRHIEAFVREQVEILREVDRQEQEAVWS